MKEDNVFKIIDGIKVPDAVFPEICEQLEGNFNSDIDKETVKAKVMHKIISKSRKSFYLHGKLRVIASIAAVFLIISVIFPAQAVQVLKRGISFVPGMGFILRDSGKTDNSYFILKNQVKINGNTGYAIIKSAYLKDKKLIVRIESSKDFLTHLSAIDNLMKNPNNNSSTMEYLQTLYSSKATEGVELINGNNALIPEGCGIEELENGKISFEYRFNNIKSNQNSFKIEFEQTNKSIAFEMLSSKLFDKSSIFEGSAAQNGIELILLAVRYENTIEADLLTKYDNKAMLHRLGFRENKSIIIRDKDNNVYSPKEEGFEYDRFMEDINVEAGNASSGKEIYSPSFHCSFEANSIKFPIRFEIPYLAFSYNSTDKNSETWIKVNVPAIGENMVCNIECKIKGIQFAISSIKRVSEENIELDFKYNPSNVNKLLHVNAYTFTRYDEQAQSNRDFQVLDYYKDGSIKKVLVGIDPASNISDILICSPEIAYYGPWIFPVESFK